jgi:hypothetical protein
MTPIRIVEERGCVGGEDMRGRIEGLCHCCQLFGRGGEQVEPLVARDRFGTNVCPNFRSTAH